MKTLKAMENLKNSYGKHDAIFSLVILNFIHNFKISCPAFANIKDNFFPNCRIEFE